MGYVNFSNVSSSPQPMSFNVDSYDSVLYPGINVVFDGLYVGSDKLSPVSIFSVEPEILNIGEIITTEDTIYLLAEAIIASSLGEVYLSDVIIGPFIINYRESIRIELLHDSVYRITEATGNTTFTGKAYVRTDPQIILDTTGSEIKSVTNSIFRSILNGANRTIHISMVQLFLLSIQKGDTYYLSDSLSPVFDVVIPIHNISDSIVANIITFPYDLVFGFRSFFINKTTPSLISYNDQPETNLDDMYYSFNPSFFIEDDDYYSPYSSMRVEARDLNDAIYTVSVQEFNYSIDGFLSPEFEIVNILAESSDYKIVDLDPYYSSEFMPSLKLYSDGSMSILEEALYSTAEWIDSGDIAGARSIPVRFILSSDSVYTSLQSYYGEEGRMLLLNIPTVKVSLQEFTSGYFTTVVGMDGVDSKKGLYKKIYSNTFEYVPYASPWHKPDSSIVRLSDWVSIDISTELSTVSVFRLEDTVYESMTLSWERRPVEPNTIFLDKIEVPGYYRIMQPSSRNFVLIALSSSGGSVLHMHTTDSADRYISNSFLRPEEEIMLTADTDSGFIADGYYAEGAAFAISDTRYKRHARVLYLSLTGVSYPSYMIEDAKTFLEQKQKYTTFFIYNEYNAYQIFELIYNKNEDAVDDSFFSSVPYYMYEGVLFSYEDVQNVMTDDILVEFNTTHRLSRLNDTTMILNSIIPSVKIAESNTYSPIIEGCGAGTLCQNSLLSSSYYVLTSSRELHAFNTVKLSEFNSDTKIKDGEYGLNVNIPESNYLFGVISLPLYLEDLRTLESELRVVLGTYIYGVSYPGTFTLGEDTLEAIISESSQFTASFPISDLSSINSEFMINVRFDTSNYTLNEIYSNPFKISINSGMSYLTTIRDDVESIWMKMFFPQSSNRSIIENVFMSMNVIDTVFSKDMIIPYRYVDNYSDLENVQGKSGESDIKEVKYKDFEDQGGTKSEEPADPICGQNRRATYLSYYGFNHILTYDSPTAIAGNYTIAQRELMNSPYMKIIARKVILPGIFLGEVDDLSRSISESILSRIEDLDVVYDWKIEDFELTKQDLIGYADDVNSMSFIEDAFRSSIKFLMDTIGEEIEYMEKVTVQKNLFPEFPDRQIDDGFLENNSVQEFIDIRRW